jgi:hypothetical protein
LTNRAGSGSVTQWYEYADPDPYQNVTDPQHWNIYCGRFEVCLEGKKAKKFKAKRKKREKKIGKSSVPDPDP